MSQDAAQVMMAKVGLEGLVVDGRKLLFEYRYKLCFCLDCHLLAIFFNIISLFYLEEILVMMQ